MSYPAIIDEIQGHNVRVLAAGNGPYFKIGNDIQVTWKAEGKDTGYVFSSYEVLLSPGQGIPIHKHPYAEFFYVLEGEVSFQRWNDAGSTEWITCSSGASALAPPNAPHTFFNRSQAAARFIATSTYHHELMIKHSETPEGLLENGYQHPTPEGFEQLNRSQRKDQVYYLEPSGN